MTEAEFEGYLAALLPPGPRSGAGETVRRISTRRKRGGKNP